MLRSMDDVGFFRSLIGGHEPIRLIAGILRQI
jgi:hypothetical protein